MISKILYALQHGFKIVKLDSRLLLVSVLVFVLPMLFLWSSKGFLQAAYDNMRTADKAKVSIIHSSLTSLLKEESVSSETIQNVIDGLQRSTSEITKLRLVDSDEYGNLIISHAINKELIGQKEQAEETFNKLPREAIEAPVIYPITVNNQRVWQVFSEVQLENRVVYVFTEHNFDLVDSLITARAQRSYLSLSVIFIFLIVLAYWLHRQTFWSKRYQEVSKKLSDRDLFSNMIAHEIRAPLTAMKGFAGILLKYPEDKKTIERSAFAIKTSAERLIDLVSDFLEVSRIQAGKLPLKITETDVRNILSAVAENLESSAKEKGLYLKYVRTSEPVLIDTDPNRLTQILTNVVSNAIKYTNEGGVELKCTEGRREVILRVMDTGMGISAQDQKRLFQPFERVGEADQSKTSGTGLGMYITKQLIEMLKGSIGVESIKGVGSHVVISLKKN